MAKYNVKKTMFNLDRRHNFRIDRSSGRLTQALICDYEQPKIYRNITNRKSSVKGLQTKVEASLFLL